MLIELAHSTPLDVAPRWRDRLRTLEQPAQRRALLGRIGQELRAYAASPTRTLPKDTRLLLDTLEGGKELPPWIQEAIPAGEEAQMAELMRQMVQAVHAPLNAPAVRGVAGMRFGMTMAQADYTTLRERAQTLGLAPSMLALADLHYHKIMEDAEHVAMLRAATDPHGPRTSDSRLAEGYLVATHQLAQPESKRGRLAGALVRPVSTLLTRPAPRAARWLAGLATRWDPSTTMRTAAQQVPSHDQRSLPPVSALSDAARLALRGEVERRVVSRAGLGQTDVTLPDVAQRLTTTVHGSAQLEALGTRLRDEDRHGRALWQTLERFSHHHQAGTLTEAVTLATPDERAALWYGSLALAGEPPASLLRNVATDHRLTADHQAHLSSAILHYARHRAKAMTAAGGAERTPTLLPTPTPTSLAQELAHFAGTLPTAHRHAAMQVGAAAQQEAVTAIQGYALELELEQLDACFGAARPDGRRLPTTGFAWSDAAVPIGHVSREPLLMDRPAGPLPFSPAEVWETIDAVERPVSPTVASVTPGLSVGHALTHTSAVAAPPAPTPPATPAPAAPVSPSTTHRTSGSAVTP